jgi:nitrogenase molybdenum-iron protein NifN
MIDMATVTRSKKSCTVNPLKMSQPIGGALAFLGLNHCMPVLHGSQGCTAFGLVLFVRHFREAIPLQTTAMNEATTIMGGFDNIEQAILNICNRTKPEIIGICSTGLTETKGDDVDGYLKLIRARHPELENVAIVYVSTPDYQHAFQDGWSKTVAHIITELAEAATAPSVARGPRLDHIAEPAAEKQENRINILPGSHLMPGDIEELREIVEAFGFQPIVLPDLSGSLDGHVPDDFSPTTLGGTTLADIRATGAAALTLAVGEQMRPACEALQAKTGVPYELFDRLTGLEASDRLFALLVRLSGRPVPNKYRRQRSQLVDAMLDGHFFFGGKKVAIGAEPDLLWGIGSWLAEMGAEITAAVTTTESPLLERLPAEEVVIGDLEDLELRAAGCDLLITHAHGRQMAERLELPFVRMGLPTFDRLGAAHRVTVGYRGTRDLVFEIGNVFLANAHGLHPRPNPPPSRGREGEGVAAGISLHAPLTTH